MKLPKEVLSDCRSVVNTELRSTAIVHDEVDPYSVRLFLDLVLDLDLQRS